MAQHHFGTPAGIWQDPYVLGFMIRTFTHYAKRATKGKISGSDLSRVYANAFSQLSNLDGAEITRLATKLRHDQDLDFNNDSGVSRSEKPADWMPAINQYTECDGCLLVSDDPQMRGIAAWFGNSGKPVWHHLADIPGVKIRY